MNHDVKRLYAWSADARQVLSKSLVFLFTQSVRLFQMTHVLIGVILN